MPNDFNSDIKSTLEEIRDILSTGAAPGGAAPAGERLAPEDLTAELEKQEKIIANTRTSEEKRAEAQARFNQLSRQQTREQQREDERYARAQTAQERASERLGERLTENLSIYGDMGTQLKGIARTTSNIIEKMIEGKGSLSWVALGKGALTGLTKAMGAFGFGLISQMEKLEGTETKFRRTTGASDQLASSIGRTYDELKGVGIRMETAEAATRSMMYGMTDFTILSGKQQQKLVETNAILGELGVSNDVFAKSVQNATKGLGVSADEADDMMLSLRATAIDLGVPVDQMTSDFASLSGELASLGQTGVKAFKDLQATAKATGLEISRLYQITGKYDTFEGAAKAAGDLNAMLGGNMVNAMELLEETDPAKRIGLIRAGLESAGVEFDDMEYYMKRAVASAAGLKDAGELAKFMSGDIEALNAEIGKTPDSMSAATKESQRLRSMSEKIENLALSMEPAINKLNDELIPSLDTFIQKLEELSGMVRTVMDDFGKWILIGTALLGILGPTGAWFVVRKLSKVVRFLATKSFKVLKTAVTGLPKLFGKMFTGAEKLAEVLGTKLGGRAFGTVMKKIPVLGGIISGLMNAWDQLTLSLDAFVEGNFAEGIGHIFGAIFKFADGFLSAIPGLFVWLGQIFGWVEEDVDANSLISSLLSPIFGGLMDSWFTFIENFDGLTDDWANLLKEIPQFFVELYIDLLRLVPRLIDGILEAFGFEGFAVKLTDGLLGSLESAFVGAINFVKDLLGIHSGSPVFTAIAQAMVDAVLGPWKDFGKPLAKFAQAGLDMLLAPFRDFKKLLTILIQEGLDTLPAPLKAALEGTAAIGGVMAAATTGRAAAPGEFMTEMIAGAGTGSDQYKMAIQLVLDGKQISEKVLDVMGGVATEAANGW